MTILQPFQEAALIDRAVGALVGLAVGDALGTTLEFSQRDSLPALTDIVGNGPFALAAGDWTDDTAMAVMLGQSLIECDEWDATDVMQRWLRWWRTGEGSCTDVCFDIGRTTAHALEWFESTGDPAAGSIDPACAGNGGIMRLAPVAIWGARRGLDATLALAEAQSRTTHAAEECITGAKDLAWLLHHAILGIGKAELFGSSVATHPFALVGNDWRNKTREDLPFDRGYVRYTLEAAIWCVYQTDNFDEAVLLAANLGGDSDTVAAVAGQIAGAVYGARSIRPAWRERIAWSPIIHALARRLLL